MSAVCVCVRQCNRARPCECVCVCVRVSANVNPRVCERVHLAVCEQRYDERGERAAESGGGGNDNRTRFSPSDRSVTDDGLALCPTRTSYPLAFYPARRTPVLRGYSPPHIVPFRSLSHSSSPYGAPLTRPVQVYFVFAHFRRGESGRVFVRAYVCAYCVCVCTVCARVLGVCVLCTFV